MHSNVPFYITFAEFWVQRKICLSLMDQVLTSSSTVCDIPTVVQLIRYELKQFQFPSNIFITIISDSWWFSCSSKFCVHRVHWIEPYEIHIKQFCFCYIYIRQKLPTVRYKSLCSLFPLCLWVVYRLLLWVIWFKVC